MATSPSTSSPSPDGPASALPSVTARVLAFLSVLVGGAAGGFIGYAFATLGDYGGVAVGVLLLVGALMGAGGVAVVAVLTLRALGEWTTIRDDPEAVGRVAAARAARKS